MPEVLESGTVMGEVTERPRAMTGLAAGTPVVVGGGDTQLGLVGIGGDPARAADPARRHASGSSP